MSPSPALAEAIAKLREQERQNREACDQRMRSLHSRTDSLDRAIQRAKTKWFWLGVVCGTVGMYLAGVIHV